MTPAITYTYGISKDQINKALVMSFDGKSSGSYFYWDEKSSCIANEYALRDLARQFLIEGPEAPFWAAAVETMEAHAAARKALADKQQSPA
jgi:hypothetical protein